MTSEAALRCVRLSFARFDLLINAGQARKSVDSAEFRIDPAPADAWLRRASYGGRSALGVDLAAWLGPAAGAVAAAPEANRQWLIVDAGDALAGADLDERSGYGLAVPAGVGLDSFRTAEFRLPPAGLRAAVGAAGLVALRFAPDGRPQYLFDTPRILVRALGKKA
jgi:hypothetical protein